MSFITYSTRAGDTWATISRVRYGDGSGAGRIAAANPGLSEPLPAGETVLVPQQARPAAGQSAAAADEPDTVALRIGGERFRWWEAVTIRRAIDEVDSFTVSAPFEPDRQAFRQAFRPLSYPTTTVDVGGAPLFVGTMLTVVPQATGDSRTVSAGGYSLPGVLTDCTSPGDVDTLEFFDLTVGDIARELVEPFGLSVAFEAGAVPGAAFADVSKGAGQTIMPFLASLAQQRGLVLGSDVGGRLVFRQAAETGQPVAVFTPDAPGPVLSVTPSFMPQQYFSHITGLEPVVVGLEGGRATVRNRRLDVIRPHTFTVPDTDGTTLQEAAEAKTGRMFGNVVSYTMELDTWRDPQGELWQPNTTVSLHWPGAMVYRPYELLVKSVELSAGADGGRRASLGLVLPGSYSGRIPEVLPWAD